MRSKADCYNDCDFCLCWVLFLPFFLPALQAEEMQKRRAAEAYRAEMERSRATDGHPVDVYVVITDQQDKEHVRRHVESCSRAWNEGRPPNTFALILYRPTIESALRDLGTGKESIFAIVLHTCSPDAGRILATIAEMWPPCALVCEMARQRMIDHRSSMQAAIETYKRTGEKGSERFLVMPLIVQCQHADKASCSSCSPGPNQILHATVLEQEIHPS